MADLYTVFHQLSLLACLLFTLEGALETIISNAFLAF